MLAVCEDSCYHVIVRTDQKIQTTERGTGYERDKYKYEHKRK